MPSHHTTPPPWGADVVWRGCPCPTGGWDGLQREYSRTGFFFAEDPGVAKVYSRGSKVFGTTGEMNAYRIKPCRTLNLCQAIHHLVQKNAAHEFLVDWMDGRYPKDESPNWIHRELEDGTLYLYDTGQSWNSLIRAAEMAGYDHVILKDLSEVSQLFTPWRQEEPVIHVVFNRDNVVPITGAVELFKTVLQQAA